MLYLSGPNPTVWIGRAKAEMENATIDLKPHGEDLSGRVHQLPCCVKHDGPASVSHYFKPKHNCVSDEGLPLQEAHFRGRLLQGTTLRLPQGYSGISLLYLFLKFNRSLLFTTIDANEWMFSAPVCGSVGFVLAKKTSPPSSKQNSNSWVSKATFQDITYWNHDYVPSHNDEMFRAFHWLTVAKAVSRF